MEREHPPPGVFWTPVIVFADVCKTPFAVLSVCCSVSTLADLCSKELLNIAGMLEEGN